MKKNWKLIAYGMTAAVILSLTACAAEEETGNPSSSGEETQDTGTADTAQYYEFLEDYYNTPAGKAELEADYEDLVGEGMSLTAYTVMNELVVTVKYEDSALLTEGIEETLAQKLDSLNDRFVQQTIEYNDIINWSSVCMVRVRYTDPEGNVLAEQTYSGQ